ncbi:MAG: 50S ribosomal protein L4, partial [Nanoarchaeota archaeon]
MKLKILDTQRKETGTIDLPAQFFEPFRPDLIKLGVLAVQANGRQPYGASPDAGMRHSVEVSRRRRKYRGSYGIGISRVPRKILSRNGTRMNWVGAEAPGMVGGRRAHPPKAEK